MTNRAAGGEVHPGQGCGEAARRALPAALTFLALALPAAAFDEPVALREAEGLASAGEEAGPVFDGQDEPRDAPRSAPLVVAEGPGASPDRRGPRPPPPPPAGREATEVPAPDSARPAAAEEKGKDDPPPAAWSRKGALFAAAGMVLGALIGGLAFGPFGALFGMMGGLLLGAAAYALGEMIGKEPASSKRQD